MSNWKPVRRGALYCSPSCGGNCTHAAYLKAHKEAEDCLRQMKTGGWSIRVHENLGWHWDLTHTDAHLTLCNSMYCGKMSYFAMLSHNTQNAGNTEWTKNDRHKDPNKAVEAVLACAQEEVNTKRVFLDKVIRGLINKKQKKTIK
jgi:hypothetical protein